MAGRRFCFQFQLTLAKNPHTFVASKTAVEMTKNGRLPQILAPAAVKNVVKPTQKPRNPIMRLETRSMLTSYFFAMIVSPGVTMGPSLDRRQYGNGLCSRLACLRCCYARTESKENHDTLLPRRGPRLVRKTEIKIPINSTRTSSADHWDCRMVVVAR